MGRIYDEFMNANYMHPNKHVESVWDLREFGLSMTHFCFVKISLINELCFGLLGRNDPSVCILASRKSVIFCCEKNYYNKLILNKV